ncbi:hypothetical protein ACLI4Z_08305 [Natrialbaceae archaeon A-arb3/5]
MRSDYSKTETTGRTPSRSRPLATDDRAIEGLPIRLVIALVVGVAALSVMMNMLGGIGEVGETEVTIEWDGDHVIEESSLSSSLSYTVVDENGNEVEDATVIVSAGSAQLDEPVHDDSGSITIPTEAGLRQDQDTGTLDVEIVPPSDSNYVDEQSNPEVVIVDG